MGGNGCFIMKMIILLCMASLAMVHGAPCPSIVFNFGDSNSDTGGAEAKLGTHFPSPEGRTFFGHPAGRWSDGRLIIDFLCKSLNTTYLSPFVESVSSNFDNGANFAISGASILPPYRPNSLIDQLTRFLTFKSRSFELIEQGAVAPVSEEGFRKAIYSIDIGQNDLSGIFGYFHSYSKVVEMTPSLIFEIMKAMEAIYRSGGRNFWVHGTGPLGCLPQKLVQPREYTGSTDSHGCLTLLNDAAKEFNAQLSGLCKELSALWSDAEIVFTDMFAVKYSIIANASSYGFEKPLMACCGSGGPPYNFDPKLMCGSPRCPVCANGTRFINWDGVHYTEAANEIASMKILSGLYSTPRLKFGSFCRN